ncbi:hypothetical protein F5888DRAFT_262615 [Russula emetica]|nr:hypothetical protein F5888DRAFT_262615 [Russula emetica]
MAEAEAKDKSSSTILKRLKETFRPLKEEPTTVVEFLLHKSLPDKNPTIVKQVLSQTSDTKEIMWNFSLFKGESRLTLKDNPHFYKRLPTSAEKYEGQFRTEPIETFHHDKISVLTDNPRLTGRVFLETAEEKRAFGNVWVPKEAIIFKDVNGKLEGESIVGKAIQKTPNLWCFEEPSLSNASWSSFSNQSSPSPTTSASPTASPTGSLIEDWREPILRMLRSQDVNIKIRISDKPPTNASLSYSPPSSPIPSSVPNSSDDSLLSPKGFQPQWHVNPITPLGSTGPPVAPAPSSPASPFILPSQSTSAPLPNTAPPVSMLPLPPTGPALAPLTACLLSDTSLQEESPRGESARLEGTISSPVPNAGGPPSGLRVTITSPLHKISTVKPSAATNVAEVARHVPSQFLGPSFAHEVVTVVPPDLGAPPPLDQAQPRAPTPQVPTPQAQTRKRNWFQKHIWDYKT